MESGQGEGELGAQKLSWDQPLMRVTFGKVTSFQGLLCVLHTQTYKCVSVHVEGWGSKECRIGEWGSWGTCCLLCMPLLRSQGQNPRSPGCELITAKVDSESRLPIPCRLCLLGRRMFLTLEGSPLSLEPLLLLIPKLLQV